MTSTEPQTTSAKFGQLGCRGHLFFLRGRLSMTEAWRTHSHFLCHHFLWLVHKATYWTDLDGISVFKSKTLEGLWIAGFMVSTRCSCKVQAAQQQTVSWSTKVTHQCLERSSYTPQPQPIQLQYSPVESLMSTAPRFLRPLDCGTQSYRISRPEQTPHRRSRTFPHTSKQWQLDLNQWGDRISIPPRFSHNDPSNCCIWLLADGPSWSRAPVGQRNRSRHIWELSHLKKGLWCLCLT